MKRFFSTSEKKENFTGFAVLSTIELLKIRGGGDTRPVTREKDIFEQDPTR